MAAQLDYKYTTPSGVPGGKADLSNTVVVSRHVADEDGKLKCGMAVKRGSEKGKTIVLEGTDFEGVLLNGGITEMDMKGELHILKGATVNVVTKGKVWVRLAENAKPKYGLPAYVVATGKDIGYFTTEKNDNLDVNAVFITEADDGIAVIELK